jgi:hypothetical protein
MTTKILLSQLTTEPGTAVVAGQALTLTSNGTVIAGVIASDISPFLLTGM